MDKVFGGTALHEVWKSGVLDRSRTPVVNYRYVHLNQIIKLLLGSTSNEIEQIVTITSHYCTAQSLFSDAIRLALLYKYGGFYSDLDVVILKSISHLKNVIASDQGNKEFSLIG